MAELHLEPKRPPTPHCIEHLDIVHHYDHDDGRTDNHDDHDDHDDDTSKHGDIGNDDKHDDRHDGRDHDTFEYHITVSEHLRLHLELVAV